MSAYPSLATTAEQGFPTASIGHSAGLFAPHGTSPEIVARMNRELRAGMKEKENTDRLVPRGIEPAAGTTAQSSGFLEQERKRLSAVAKKANMTTE